MVPCVPPCFRDDCAGFPETPTAPTPCRFPKPDCPASQVWQVQPFHRASRRRIEAVDVLHVSLMVARGVGASAVARHQPDLPHRLSWCGGVVVNASRDVSAKAAGRWRPAWWRSVGVLPPGLVGLQRCHRAPATMRDHHRKMRRHREAGTYHQTNRP